MSNSKLALLLGLITIVIGAAWLLPADLLTLDNLKNRQADIETYRAANPIQTVLLFCGIYIAVTALSIPGAAILTLAAGAIFGLLSGVVWVSISSTIGATIAFLLSRYFFQSTVKQKFGAKLDTIEANLEKDGAFYLFSLRLVPVVPFFMINLLMGLTPIKVWVYAAVSWVGMLAGTIVYVNAGTQLSKLDSLSGILSPAIIGSFALLAAFPYLARYLIKLVRKTS